MSRSFPLLPSMASLCLLASLAGCGGGGGGGGSTQPPGGNPPVIASFSPTAGAVGTQVTIHGLLFDATPQGNTVRFGGVAATVLSASATALVAAVPAGAATGRIQVTTAGGSATGDGDFTVLSGLGAAWTTRLAGPRGRPSGLAFTGTRFATVGSGGGFQSSEDALVWTVRSAFSSADDLAWDGSMMIAVGSSYWVSTSPDGISWTMRSLPAGSSDLHGVARSPDGWVAVGSGICSSPDGVTWTARDPGTTKQLRAVTWTGARYVAVGEDGAVVTSPDGATWTPRPAPTADSFTTVGSSTALVVATTFPYPGSQSALMTTPDGGDWTTRSTGSAPFNRVIHAGGRFVGVGYYAAATSADGIDWTTNSAVPGIPEAIVHTGAGYVAVGTDRNSAGAVFTSSDGLDWSLRSADHDLVAIARRPADGRLVVVGSDVARSSADGGETWNLDLLTASLWENYPFLDAVWSPTADFVALVQLGANQYAYRSSDGRAWTQVAYVPCHGGLAVSESGRLLATGSSLSGSCVATSDDDGATWAPRTPPAGGRLEKAFWLGDQFVAVGPSGALATSPDGASWTSRSSGVTTVLRGAARSPATLVVVGDAGVILTSADGGATWTPRASGTTYPLRRVTWTGSEFFAVGGSGRLLRSPDGAAWTTQPTPYTASPSDFALNDLAWIPEGGGRLVLVGDGGLVATSP